jgi:hypothetical protein
VSDVHGEPPATPNGSQPMTLTLAGRATLLQIIAAVAKETNATGIGALLTIDEGSAQR